MPTIVVKILCKLLFVIQVAKSIFNFLASVDIMSQVAIPTTLLLLGLTLFHPGCFYLAFNLAMVYIYNYYYCFILVGSPSGIKVHCYS